MLKTILSISGKPGLYKLISQGKNMIVVESLVDNKRMPAYNHDRIASLADIAIFTNETELPLSDVMETIFKKENGAVSSISNKASNDELKKYFEEVIPDYDRDRFRVSDMKKVVSWYNILVNAGFKEFATKEEETTQE